MPDYNGGAPITEFSVEMTAADNVTSEVHRATADITECTVNSLLPGRTYDFRLRSCNKIGVSRDGREGQMGGVGGVVPPPTMKRLQ